MCLYQLSPTQLSSQFFSQQHFSVAEKERIHSWYVQSIFNTLILKYVHTLCALLVLLVQVSFSDVVVNASYSDFCIGSTTKTFSNWLLYIYFMYSLYRTQDRKRRGEKRRGYIFLIAGGLPSPCTPCPRAAALWTPAVWA